MSRPIRTLLFSTLFSGVSRPIHGVYVETRLRELPKTGKVETRVFAPVVTARGTDIKLIPDYVLPQRMIRWTAARAQGLGRACRALVDDGRAGWLFDPGDLRGLVTRLPP